MCLGKALPAKSESSQNKPPFKGIISRGPVRSIAPLLFTAAACAYEEVQSRRRERDDFLTSTFTLISKIPAKAK